MPQSLLPTATLVTVRRQRLLVASLHGLALLLLSLHHYVRTLPPTPTPIPTAADAEMAWWGFWPVTAAPAWAVTLATFLIVGWIAGWWVTELRSTERATQLADPTSHTTQLIVLLLVTILLLIACYAFPIAHTRWGDAYLLAKAIGWPDPALRLTHSWQAPLDVLLHSQIWLWLHSGWGWGDALPVYRLLSPWAGLLYLLAAIGLAYDQREAPTWLTFGLLASLGVLQLFFGYVENYSFAAAGVLIYLWLGLRTLAGRSPLWLTASALALTHAFHPSTIVLAPSLIYCGWRWLWKSGPSQGKLRPRNGLSTTLSPGLSTILSLAVPMLLGGLAVIGLMELGGHGLAALTSTDRPGGGDARLFVPLWATTTRWEHYTMFSWGHVRDFLNEQILVAPVVLPTLLVIWLAGVLWQGRKQGVGKLITPSHQADEANKPKPSNKNPNSRFLLLATGCYLLFIWVWNPDYGGQRDWDLFSLATIPAALWLATSLPRRFADQRYLQAGAIPLLMLQWLHLAAWIYQNTLPWEWP